MKVLLAVSFACLTVFVKAGFEPIDIYGDHDDGQWHGEGWLESQSHGVVHAAVPIAAVAYGAHGHDDGQWHGEGLLESQDHEAHGALHVAHAIPVAHHVAVPHPIPVPVPHAFPVPVAHHVPIAHAVPVVHASHHGHGHGFSASVAGPSGHVATHS
ncbi:uncharacterized protein LOC108743198 isoform X1 [Agrilus planipennis]|uniref:Uncharacterized protein LOC108743198 isoform X1 n=1 Tax=Agrilus planipennis TaxID=224129 RepID=A0A1W4XNW9_AGRPL|nr:uncharacterized protein LOC108743198 isoform X1 [Agrilus planipennis]